MVKSWSSPHSQQHQLNLFWRVLTLPAQRTDPGALVKTLNSAPRGTLEGNPEIHSQADRGSADAEIPLDFGSIREHVMLACVQPRRDRHRPPQDSVAEVRTGADLHRVDRAALEPGVEVAGFQRDADEQAYR